MLMTSEGCEGDEERLRDQGDFWSIHMDEFPCSEMAGARVAAF